MNAMFIGEKKFLTPDFGHDAIAYKNLNYLQ